MPHHNVQVLTSESILRELIVGCRGFLLQGIESVAAAIWPLRFLEMEAFVCWLYRRHLTTRPERTVRHQHMCLHQIMRHLIVMSWWTTILQVDHDHLRVLMFTKY